MPLYDKLNYTADIPYIVSHFIREYDIKQANINALLYKGIISEATYREFQAMPKYEREVKIGLMIRDSRDIYDAIKSGIIEAKRLLFEANQINDNEVLSIKNDAVYILDRQLQYTEFGPFKFVNKNIYTSFYNILKKEFYYYCDTITGLEKLDVKGIKDDQLSKHNEYFLDFVLNIMFKAQNSSLESVLDAIQRYYADYINLRLPIGNYRKFDAESFFEFKTTSFNIYRSDFIPITTNLRDLDISYNATIITELYKIFTSIFFNSIK